MVKPLWEFVEKRMKELGMTRHDLETEHDIAYATVQRLKAGSTNIKDSTKQKLALALQCSVGDINAAISGSAPELPKMEPDEPDAEIGSVNLSGITEATRKAGALEAPKNEPAKKGTAKKERQKERWPEDPPEEASGQKGEVMYSEREVDEICKKRINEYKQQLKDLSLKTLTSVPKLNVSGETPYGIVGRALIEKLLESEAEAE